MIAIYCNIEIMITFEITPVNNASQTVEDSGMYAQDRFTYANYAQLGISFLTIL